MFTTDFPPYSYTENGRLTGLCTEIVQSVFAKAGITGVEYEVHPWARAYTMALDHKGSAVYSIARSPDRETLFHWIGPIAPYDVNLYKLKRRKDIRVQTLEDAKRYKVGGEIKDIKQEYLQAQGFILNQNLELADRDEINLRKLFAERIDLIPFDAFSLPMMLRKEGFRPEALEKVLPLPGVSHGLYLAVSLDVPQVEVERLQAALESLRMNGELARIHQRYLGEDSPL
ncbi:transporter substrate-binding domain-containing protein [Marinobacteraceae bacterium S3BR75-40.1]